MARVTPVRIALTVAFIIAAVLGIRLVALNFFVLNVGEPDRQAYRCSRNLKLIDACKMQWALEKNKGGDATPSWEDLQHYIADYWTNGKPVCPAGGIYTIGALNTLPTCSIGDKGHSVN